eukprot:1264254-Rhodomonas_salina.1
MDDSAGPLDPAALVTWAQGLSMRMDGDFDQLAAPLALRPGPWQWKVKGVLRAWTPQMMSAVAVLASGLLLYALHNLYVDLKSNRARDRNAKVPLPSLSSQPPPPSPPPARCARPLLARQGGSGAGGDEGRGRGA